MRGLTLVFLVTALLVGAVDAFARAERALAPKPGCDVSEAGQGVIGEPTGELAGLRGELIADGLNPATGMTQMPGSNTFLVVEKAGRVMAVQDGDVMSPPVLDIRDQVSNDWNERGLLSIETHPDFAENCIVFLFFTDLAGDSNLVAATVTESAPLTIDPVSIETILVVPQNHPYHQSGSMTFGPEGYLWVSIGDGGSATNGILRTRGPSKEA